MRLGYLYSRYPVLSQTFCDAEMLALERLGFSLRSARCIPRSRACGTAIGRFRAPIHYAPPQEFLKISSRLRNAVTAFGRHFGRPDHERKYGPGVKAEQRARNALFFADHFMRSGVDHVHVHFANHATHTGIFMKEIQEDCLQRDGAWAGFHGGSWQ